MLRLLKVNNELTSKYWLAIGQRFIKRLNACQKSVLCLVVEKIVFFITLHAQIMINCCDYQAELLHSFEGEQSDYLL